MDTPPSPSLEIPPPVAVPPRAMPRAGLGCFPFLALVLGMFFAVLLVFLALFWPGPLGEGKAVLVPQGARVRDIAELLLKEGVIAQPTPFRLGAKILANDNLHAGEYEFVPEQNLLDVLLDLRDGNVIARQLTLAEGLSSFEIVRRLRDETSLTGEIATMPPEGSLLPETYQYSYGNTRSGLIERMQKSQREQLKVLWEKRAADLPFTTPQQAMVLASIVEKETGKKAEERARVAGVFVNRLRQGMRLQSDPTVLYALSLSKGGEPWAHSLTHADLAFASPYNTYVNVGLPPTPICNPGKAALEAVLHPEANDYIYFVADGTGGHAFARTLAEHNQNVARWIKLQRP